MILLTKISGRRLTFGMIRPGPLIFLFFALSYVAVLAKNPAEYRKNIINAQNSTLELLRAVEDSTALPEKYAEIERKSLAAIRRDVPETEKIEWDGTVVETDNRWLHESLRSFEEESGDTALRVLILTGIGRRLDALIQKVGEIPDQQTVQRSKDDEKNKLAEILRREEYQRPAAADKSLFQRILAAIRKWLADWFPKVPISQDPSGGLGTLASILQIVLAACVIGGIGFLIYRFAPLIFKRNRGVEPDETPERFILGEKLAHDENSRDIFRDAERLALEGNIRGAIRKGYIALLCELSDRKIIGLARHKTNRDYLRDVRADNNLYRDVNGMTSNFERHWYGFDPAGEDAWQEFKNDYRRTLSGRP